MRAPDLQPLAAGVCALLLVASLAWWALSAPELIDPGQPTWKGADIVRLKASVPEIPDFREFYVNDDNPFVPLQARLSERERRNPTRRVDPTPPRPDKKMPPPKPPVEVVEKERPVLVLPKLSPVPNNAPLTYGLVVVDNQEAVIVRMPGATQSITMKPGTKEGGWTLVSIDNGNLATFLDPQGVEQRFAIGLGDLASALGPAEAVPGGKDAAGKGVPGRGMGPKLPGAGGQGARPGTNGGAEGPIPRPPSREERHRKDQPKVPPTIVVPQPAKQ